MTAYLALGGSAAALAWLALSFARDPERFARHTLLAYCLVAGFIIILAAAIMDPGMGVSDDGSPWGDR